MKMLHRTAILKTTAIKHTIHKMKITPAEQQNFVGQTQESKTKKNVCSFNVENFQLIKSKNIIKTSFANIMLNISMHKPCENVSRAATAGQYNVKKRE